VQTTKELSTYGSIGAKQCCQHIKLKLLGLETQPKAQVLKKPRHLSLKVVMRSKSLIKQSLKIGLSSSDAEVIVAVSENFEV